MNKAKKSMLAAACALALAGCAQASVPSEKTEGSQPSQSTPATAAPNAEQTPEAANPEAQQMDEKAAVKLFAEGMKRFWHMMSGGVSDGGVIQSFPVNGVDHRYMGKDLDTKEKLLTYLQAVYTKEASEELIKNAGIIEHEGRMAQPNADGGSLLQPEKAEATLVEESADTKKYELKVPVGDDASTPPEIMVVEVKKTGEGWRINLLANKQN